MLHYTLKGEIRHFYLWGATPLNRTRKQSVKVIGALREAHGKEEEKTKQTLEP